MPIFVWGLDLGQAQDYTALVNVQAFGTERVVNPLAGAYAKKIETLPLVRLDIRHIERFPLGTKYKEIAGHVQDRIRRTPIPRYLAVDQTGVGVAAVEMLSRLSPIGVTITAGSEVGRGNGPQDYRVPKRELVAALQVGLQNGQLRIAQGLLNAELLTREMLAFRAKISAAGHDTYEAWREADHDDLVLAAGIACWAAKYILWSNGEYAMASAAHQPIDPNDDFNAISPF